jgi:hypothetical protein
MKSCIHSIKSLISYCKTAFFTPGGSQRQRYRQRYSFNRYGVALTALKALSPLRSNFNRSAASLTSRFAAMNRTTGALYRSFIENTPI